MVMVRLRTWIRRQVNSLTDSDLLAIKVGSVAGLLLFVYFDDEMQTFFALFGANVHIYIPILKNHIELFSICFSLLVFGLFFIYPFIGKTSEPLYSYFSCCYILWILVATLYHLPVFQSTTRMYLSLFFTYYISSILCLFVFYISFYGLWCIGLVARVLGKDLEIWTIILNSAVISLCSCLLYRSCAIKKEKPDWFSAQWAQICSSDRISPIYFPWAIFISLHIVNFVVAWYKRALIHEEYDRQPKKPDFLDMVTWHSGTSTDLYKTVFNLLVSVTLFLGRFDMRMMQAAMIQDQDRIHRDQDRTQRDQDGIHAGDFFYDQFSDKEELWFDFMADTGDGGSSSYAVAKLLAQRSIDNLVYKDEVHNLSRGDLLLIGGDLAYPNPSPETYEDRFFYPFQEALQSPSSYKSEHITINKRQYDGPQCFIIPGNHDWFDGLHTFMRYICHKSWLGGWFLPQKKSYFALQLPKGWWVFGLDQALHEDIDAFQFKFFAEFIENKVDKNDSVIIMTHEPNWLSDWYWNDVTGENVPHLIKDHLKKDTGKNVSHLIKDHLKGRCKLRMAGDLHHYMRHSCESENPAYVPHLLVNGGGGAFLHPTHVFKKFNQSNGTTYENEAAYPSFKESYKLAWGNIFNFRKKNWEFDFIGGIIYFILVSSLFPQCKLDHILQNDSFYGFFKSFFGDVWPAFKYVFQQSYTSLAGTVLMLIAAYKFVPSKEVPLFSRLVIGLLHVSAHLFSALILMLVLELGIEWFIRNRLLATSGYHTLYEWYRSVESKHFPDPTGLRTRIERWTFGLYPACLKYLMSAFDIPEVMAVTRNNICKHGIQSLSRWSGVFIYYASVFIYFWVFSTPAVSLVFGIYLYICINWFHIHFDEAFSSLRIANYKALTRFHITKAGDLDVFTLAVDKVPKDWKLDPYWNAESNQPQMPSHLRNHPSKWTAYISEHDPLVNVRIVDHFTINHTEQDDEARDNEHMATDSEEEYGHTGNAEEDRESDSDEENGDDVSEEEELETEEEEVDNEEEEGECIEEEEEDHNLQGNATSMNSAILLIEESSTKSLVSVDNESTQSSASPPTYQES